MPASEAPARSTPDSTELAISASHIVKQFRPSGGATSLKERLLGQNGTSKPPFVALNDVSLDIPRGHTIGLIGHNGSGKSTLLKILAGILQPTTGTVQVFGRIASLLELGAGFNGELTGRENVYLNASLLGLSRRETEGLYDSIVEFSELQAFMDEPVKHYSSGMYVRLGFAVAVHVDPDILLVDEVLAVGDEAFAHKCMNKIAEFQEEGRTILVVSHGLDALEKICDRVVVLDHGSVIFDGDPAYGTGVLRMMLGTTPVEAPVADEEDRLELPPSPVEILSATVHHDGEEQESTRIHAGEKAEIRVAVRVDASAIDLCRQVTVVVMGLGQIPIMILRHDDGPIGLGPEGGLWEISFHIDPVPPVAGGMVLAVQVDDGFDLPVATFTTTKGFVMARDGELGGIVLADYVSSARTRARTTT